jgi:hypothetical protein
MKNNFGFIFYIYYFLVLVLTLSDLFLFNITSSSIYFALASAFIGLVLQIFYKDYKNQKNKIIENLTSIPRIELYHEEEFYSFFKYMIKNAKNNVDITHLSLESPINSNKPEQKKYYSEFVKTVKNKPKVIFRRVERVSAEKIPWIEKLLNDFSGVTNFSLYCLVEPIESRNLELSDLISIQRVDNEHTFIVALLEHTSTTGARDIYFRDKSITEFFREYYQKRLIQKSKPIITNGRPNIANWELIKIERL